MEECREAEEGNGSPRDVEWSAVVLEHEIVSCGRIVVPSRADSIDRDCVRVHVFAVQRFQILRPPREVRGEDYSGGVRQKAEQIEDPYNLRSSEPPPAAQKQFAVSDFVDDTRIRYSVFEIRSIRDVCKVFALVENVVVSVLFLAVSADELGGLSVQPARLLAIEQDAAGIRGHRHCARFNIKQHLLPYQTITVASDKKAAVGARRVSRPSPLELPESSSRPEHTQSTDTQHPNAMADTTTVAVKKDPQFFYILRRKLFYAPSYSTVDKGGVLVVKCGGSESIPLVTLDQFRGMLTSQSEKCWSPFLRPSNLLFTNFLEGVAPFAVFRVEGHEIASRLLLLPPFDVLAKVMPKLYEEAKQDPKGSGCGSLDPADFPGKSDEYVQKKIAENKARLNALKWTPEDCKADRGGGLKPCRPNVEASKWSCLSKGENDMWLLKLAPLVDNLREAKAAAPTKCGGIKSHFEKEFEKELEKRFPMLKFSTMGALHSDKTFEMTVRPADGEEIVIKQVGDVTWVSTHQTGKSPRAGKRARPYDPEEDAADAADDADEVM
jgi:hypothetical protein